MQFGNRDFVYARLRALLSRQKLFTSPFKLKSSVKCREKSKLKENKVNLL